MDIEPAIALIRARKNAASRRYKSRLRGEPTPYLTKPWSGREVLALSDLYSRGQLNRDGQLKKLAKELNRTFAAVALKAHDLGLTGTRGAVGRAQPDSTRLAVSKAREQEMKSGSPGGRGRGLGGRRSDLDNRYFRSAWEANYARYLLWSQIAWEYEPTTFRFEGITRGQMSYTPDFWLPGLGVYHEVKGWMDDKSRVKLARMAKFFPAITVVVIDKDWFRVAHRNGLSRVVPNWEGLNL